MAKSGDAEKIKRAFSTSSSPCWGNTGRCWPNWGRFGRIRSMSKQTRALSTKLGGVSTTLGLASAKVTPVGANLEWCGPNFGRCRRATHAPVRRSNCGRGATGTPPMRLQCTRPGTTNNDACCTTPVSGHNGFSWRTKHSASTSSSSLDTIRELQATTTNQIADASAFVACMAWKS